MGTPGVGSAHTLFLFTTPTTNAVHWPAGRVDGAASFQAQIFFLRLYYQLFYNIKLFLTYIKRKLCFATQRLNVSDPGDRDMADTVSLGLHL